MTKNRIDYDKKRAKYVKDGKLYSSEGRATQAMKLIGRHKESLRFEVNAFDLLPAVEKRLFLFAYYYTDSGSYEREHLFSYDPYGELLAVDSIDEAFLLGNMFGRETEISEVFFDSMQDYLDWLDDYNSRVLESDELTVDYLTKGAMSLEEWNGVE